MIPLKCSVYGLPQTGKSSLINLLKDENSQNKEYHFQNQNQQFRVTFIETATCPKDLNNYQIFIFIFDLGQKKSFNNITQSIINLYEEIKSQHLTKKIIIVGNKADENTKKQVTFEDIQNLQTNRESIEYQQIICKNPPRYIDKVQRMIINFVIDNQLTFMTTIQQIQVDSQPHPPQPGKDQPNLSQLSNQIPQLSNNFAQNQDLSFPQISLNTNNNDYFNNSNNNNNFNQIPDLHSMNNHNNSNFLNNSNNQFQMQQSHNQLHTPQNNAQNQLSQDDQRILLEIQQQHNQQSKQGHIPSAPSLNLQNNLILNNISPIKYQEQNKDSQYIEPSELDILNNLNHSAQKNFEKSHHNNDFNNHNNPYQEINQMSKMQNEFDIAQSLVGPGSQSQQQQNLSLPPPSIQLLSSNLHQQQHSQQQEPQQQKKTKFQPPNKSSIPGKYKDEKQSQQQHMPTQNDIKKEKLIVNLFKESANLNVPDQQIQQPPIHDQLINNSQISNQTHTLNNSHLGKVDPIHMQQKEPEQVSKQQIEELFGKSHSQQNQQQFHHSHNDNQSQLSDKHMSKTYQQILDNTDNNQSQHKYSKAGEGNLKFDQYYNNEYQDSPTIQKDGYGAQGGHDFSFQEEETDPHYLKGKSASFDNLLTQTKVQNHNFTTNNQKIHNNSNNFLCYNAKTERDNLIHSNNQGHQIRCVPSFKMDLGTEEIYQVQQQQSQHQQRGEVHQRSVSNINGLNQNNYNASDRKYHQRQKSLNSINQSNHSTNIFRQENQFNQTGHNNNNNNKSVLFNTSTNPVVKQMQNNYSNNYSAKEIMKLHIYIDDHLEILEALDSDTAYSLVHKLLHKLNISPKLTTIKRLVEIIQQSINQYCHNLDNYINKKKLYNNYKSLNQFCQDNLNFLNNEVNNSNPQSQIFYRAKREKSSGSLNKNSSSNAIKGKGTEVGKLYIGTHNNTVGVLTVYENDNAYDLAEQFIVDKGLNSETYDYLLQEIQRIQVRWKERYYGKTSVQNNFGIDNKLQDIIGTSHYTNNDLNVSNPYIKKLNNQQKINQQCSYHNKHDSKHNQKFDFINKDISYNNIQENPVMQSQVLSSLGNQTKQYSQQQHFFVNVDVGKGNIIKIKINKEDSILKIVQRLTIKYKLTRERENQIIDILQKNYDRVFRVVRK